MSIFPCPKDSEYSWIGSPESRPATYIPGMQHLIDHRDQIEVLGGWKMDNSKLIHYAERAVFRLVNKDTSELEYFSAQTIANRLDYLESPSKGVSWKTNFGPMTRDELVSILTERGSSGDLLLLPYLTDTALGYTTKKPYIRNCWQNH